MHARNILRFPATGRIHTFIFTLFSITFSPLLAAQTANIQEMQELVERWIIVEQQETALVTDWQNQQQIMQQRLVLLDEEGAQLEGIVSTNTSNIDEVTERRLTLLELQNSMEDSQQKMEQALLFALRAVNSLHAQLPPPLVEAWQERLDLLASQTGNDVEKNSNTQLQALLEMLTQFQDFEQRVSLNEDTITTPDGNEVLVKQLYLGVSHAWYVSPDGQFSGYGQSSPNGWVWLEKPVVDAETVQQAIAMLERNVNVQLIELPIILQSPPLQANSGETP